MFSRLLKSPLVHFLILGGILFLAQSAWHKHFDPPPVFVQKELIISKSQIEQFKKDIFIQTGSRPTAEQLQHLVQVAIDDEVLYREALALKVDKTNPSVRRRLIDLGKIAAGTRTASDTFLYNKALKLGLDRYDPVVRRILIGTMRLIAKKIPTHIAPGKVAPKDLEAYYEANAALFVKPAEMKFTHLYFSRDKRGAKGKKQAQLVLQKLSQGAKPEDLQDKGNAFLGGNHFSWMTPASLERLFGPAFPEALIQISPGKWSGPIVSSYGWHLVFVEELRPARPATLPEVTNQIKSAILQEREKQRLAETLQRLRSHYQIRIEEEETPHA